MTITSDAALVYRDREGAIRWNPKKDEIRALFALIDQEKLAREYAIDAPFAEPRDQSERAFETASVEEWDKTGRDDQTVLEYALAAVTSSGGALRLTGRKSRTIEENLAIPATGTFTGPRMSADTNLATFNFGSDTGVLRLHGGAQIVLGNETTLESWRIMPSNLTTPFANLTAARAGVAAMETAGTKAIVNGSTGYMLRNLQILGFTHAFESSVGQRGFLYNVKMDCTNGISIYESADFMRIVDCAYWPWLTGNQGFEGANNASYDVLARGGTAYLIDGATPGGGGGAINDWPILRGNSAFGAKFSLRIEGADHVTVDDFSGDNVPQLYDAGGAYTTRAQSTIGTKVGNGSRNIVLDNVRHAAQGRSFVVEATGEAPRVAITSPRSWSPFVRHIHHVSGDMVLDDTGGLEANGPSGTNLILLEDAIGSADITISGASNPTISASATALAKTTFNKGRVITVASASAIAVQPYWKRINLTGTTNVGTITAVSPGQILVLSSTSSLQILHGGNIKLKNGIRFQFASAADRLMLECDGTNWNEIGRSGNNQAVVATTPTLSSATGTMTLTSIALNTRLTDDVCEFSATVTITNAGTGGGSVSFPLPYQAAVRQMFVAGDVLVNNAAMTAWVAQNGTTLTIRRYDNGNVPISGSVIIVTGSYRVAV